MSQPYTKDILNSLYHSVITTGQAVAYSIIGTKIIKLDVGDQARYLSAIQLSQTNISKLIFSKSTTLI